MWLLGLVHKVFEVVVLMLLESSEQQVKYCFPVCTSTLPCLLAVLLVDDLWMHVVCVLGVDRKRSSLHSPCDLLQAYSWSLASSSMTVL